MAYIVIGLAIISAITNNVKLLLEFAYQKFSKEIIFENPGLMVHIVFTWYCPPVLVVIQHFLTNARLLVNLI